MRGANTGMNSVQNRPLLARKFRNAYRTLQTAGVKGLWMQAWKKAEQKRLLSAARDVKTVELDGCRFTLEVPADAVKVSLLKGRYERFERDAVVKYLDPQYPVIELGACLGVVACVTNRLLSDPRKHVVVEANPQVVPVIKKNRELNGSQFEILNMAVAYDQSTVSFSPSPDPRGTSLRSNEQSWIEGPQVTVPATGLGKIAEERGFESFTLICDIEGHEYELIQREASIVNRARMIIIETHGRMIGEEKNSEILARLEGMGFRTVAEDSGTLVLKRES
jgi:FkbM family methyltransferase